jgi:hypothetical protein
MTAWFRTTLPVEGRVVGMVRATSTNGSPSPASGTVRISRAGTAAVQVDFSELHVSSEPDADLRVQLSASDVVIGADGVGSIVRNGTASGIVGGDPIEVGLLARDASTTTLTFTTPQILPSSVHSLLVLDYRHATVLAGAELVPVDG